MYPITATVSFEYIEGGKQSASNDLTMSVPVVQPDKVQFQQIALADKTVNVDEESDCSFQIINMGQTKLSNGTVKLVDSKGKELNSAYVGNIEAGGQFASNYTLPVTFDKTGEYKLKLIFEYENENMDKKSIEQEFKVKVEKPTDPFDNINDSTDNTDNSEEQDNHSTSKIKTYIGCGVGAAAVVIAAVVIIKKRKHKKGSVKFDEKSDIFAMAWQNLRNRKTRTRLTIAGVVIGTCAIIIMLSIGIGIDKMITSQYKQDSTLNKITVYSMGDYTNDSTGEVQEAMPFDESAVNYFSKLDNVKTVVPTLEISQYVNIAHGKYTYSGSVYGIPLKEMEMLGYKTDQGDFKKYGERNACFFGKDLIQYFSDVQGNSPKYKYDENYNISESEFDFMKDTFTINAKISKEVMIHQIMLRQMTITATTTTPAAKTKLPAARKS